MLVERVVVGLLLDDGGRGLGRWLGALALVAVVGLLLTVTAPVLVLAAVWPGAALGTGPAPLGAGPAPWEASLAPNQVKPAPAVAAAPQGGTPGLVGNTVVDVARRYLGVRYVFGGTNPAIGLDCSGLVQLVFRQLGVALPRTAQTQFDGTARVAQSELQPGDLVFFARTYADPNDWVTHVGIYIGGGMQINAPTEGQVVSIQPVFSGFWGAHYAAGGRVRWA